jgi:hypothetical protein
VFAWTAFSGLYGQSLSSLRASSTQDQSSPFGGHSQKKAMGSFPLCIAEICQILFHSLYSGENNKELDKPYQGMFVKVNFIELSRPAKGRVEISP